MGLDVLMNELEHENSCRGKDYKVEHISAPAEVGTGERGGGVVVNGERVVLRRNALRKIQPCRQTKIVRRRKLLTATVVPAV